jgi:RHS repeat-associated protein
MSSTPSLDTNYSLPGVITPNENANLATTLTYSGSWAVTSLTGPNGANSATTYDGWGRPTTTKIPDGAVTTYGYAYVKVDGTGVNQQTAMLGTGTAARWKRTTLDGFGRVVRVESGNGLATTPAVSQVDTQYAPCACSPLGKMWRVSMPYAPSGAPIWTTYTYDGSGRTLTVTAPDGSVTRTEYLSAYGGYTGNLVRMTDPAGKWKIQQTDAMGNLIRVIEPNPGRGADWITSYTYDVLGHLTGVSMPRSNGTQTRTFVYTGVDLMSATNPENGTVTYQYDASHHVTKRTDAKGQETRYTYDAYGRLTEVQHWATPCFGCSFQELPKQRVDYSYDINPLNASYSQNAWGRLAAVQFLDENLQPMSYMYSYNQAGRVAAQRMDYNGRIVGEGSFEATYAWDNEGRMTGINYGPQYTFQYDANGRLSGMVQPPTDQYPYEWTLATATYGVAGQMTGFAYQESLNGFRYNESRAYNSMLQMTGIGAAQTNGVVMMNMAYVYTAGANNGRIAQSIDGLTNETVNYTYDAVNRLSGVSATGATSGAWTQGYTYDGFGNLTAKTAVGAYPAWNGGADPATNRQNGMSYDANGNAGTIVAGITFAYDVENRLIQGGVYGSQETYAYDPSGKRVKKAKRNSEQMLDEEFSFYGIGGQKLATMACLEGSGDNGGWGCTGWQYNVYFGGKLLLSKGVQVVMDRLGSVRATAPSMAFPQGERMSYYPYGEERTSTADGREKFGTYTRDNPTQDYADQRYYAVGTGRFNSPDPFQASGGPADPASWNRYAYTRGDPVNRIDPNGLADFSVTGYCYGCSGDGPSGVSGNMDRSVYGSGNGMDMALPEIGDGEGAPAPGGGAETEYEPPPPKCPDWAARFFQNMGIYNKMAEQANVNVNFVMALSALESHWDDTHAQDLGNLFGLTHGGHKNIDFRNNKTLSEQAGYQASADYWTSHYGSKVAGATDLATFWSDLQPKKGKYNSKNSDYFSTLSDVYDSVLQRRKDCDK